MFKLLRVNASGLRLLEDGIEINLLNRSKVMDEDFDRELMAIEENLNTFKVVSIVGGNSSGKSSVLYLLIWAYLLLLEGRLYALPGDFRGEEAHMEIVFYLDGTVYFYEATFQKPQDDISFRRFPNILEESLRSIPYTKRKGRHVLEMKESAKEEKLPKSIVGGSAIAEMDKGMHFSFFAENQTDLIATGLMVNRSFFDQLAKADMNVAIRFARLLDPSIASIRLLPGELVEFARNGEEPKTITRNQLIGLLSSGTIRGLELFLRAYEMLKTGGTLVVDEVENSLHKDIVGNLIFLFTDFETNPRKAQLIFTTHSMETLNLIKRLDAIYVAQKEGNRISLRNLKGDLKVRSGLLISHQFDAGIFGTNLNYDLLLEVRKGIADELGSGDV